MSKIFYSPLKKSDKTDRSSLNYYSRKKYYDKINADNKNLLKRLKNKNSIYNAQTFAHERKIVEHRIKMISTYPKKSSISPKKPKKQTNSTLKTPKLVYKKRIHLNNKKISIEIYDNSENFVIIAIDTLNSDIFRLILSYEETLEFLDYQEDWERLLSCLRIEEDAIVLVYPSS
jgi:hypothetical protein